MAFTVEDYYALLRLLHEHPEWRPELRRLVLSDELLALPEIVRELAEAQRRTEARIEALAEAQQRTEAHLSALTEAQRRTEERLEALTQRVEALAEAQRRTEERLEALTQRVDELTQRVDTLTQRMDVLTQRVDTLTQRMDELTQRVDSLTQRMDELTQRVDALTQRMDELTQRMDELTQRVDALTVDIQRLTLNVAELSGTVRRLSDRLDRVVGDILELRYREHAGGYFGTWVRGARVIAPVELEETLQERLTYDEVLDVLRLDLLVRGRWRALPEAPEVWLAVEVSSVIDEGDVARAWRRARLLRRAGYRAVPVVAGERIIPEAQASAQAQTVGVVQDGQVILGNEELATWLRD